MDSNYLKVNIGKSLTAGITEVLKHNPEDPVDYLAKYLLRQDELKKEREEALKSAGNRV